MQRHPDLREGQLFADDVTLLREDICQHLVRVVGLGLQVGLDDLVDVGT